MGWFADYPTYDNFMYDLFHSDSLDGNNYGFVNDEFDALVDEAKSTPTPTRRPRSSRRLSRSCSTTRSWRPPINWYRGDYAYDQDKVVNFPQTNFGLIIWEQVKLKAA